MAASAESPDTGPRAGQGRVRVAISSDNINGNADGSSTISPSLELLPPSPTHSLSLLGPDEDSDTEELPEAFRPPSRLAEIAAFCAGKASVRSREREHAREREREDEAAAFALALARGEPSPASLASPVSPASPASALLAPRSPLSPGWSRTPVSPLSDVSDAPGPVPSPTLSIGSVGSVGSAGTGKGASRWWPRISGQPRNRISLSVGQHAREPFAADVAVRGWQVVGGKSWTGGGKVGAYVGECSRAGPVGRI
jgi:hypothetical protein